MNYPAYDFADAVKTRIETEQEAAWSYHDLGGGLGFWDMLISVPDEDEPMQVVWFQEDPEDGGPTLFVFHPEDEEWAYPTVRRHCADKMQAGDALFGENDHKHTRGKCEHCGEQWWFCAADHRHYYLPCSRERSTCFYPHKEKMPPRFVSHDDWPELERLRSIRRLVSRR